MRVRKILFLIGALIGLAASPPGQSAGLVISSGPGPMQLGIQGPAGRDYILQGTSNPGQSNSWQDLLTLTLTNNSLRWFDSSSTVLNERFYRAIELGTPIAPAFANNFRLIDHLGKWCELYYFKTNKVIVLIFTGNGCAKVQQMLPTIKALRNQFTSQGVLFWLVDANSQDNRSNIVAEAASLGIDLPILYDDAQVVARDYSALNTPEAVCIGTTNWTVFYRGAIDDRMTAVTNVTTQSYLSEALKNFLAGRVVTPQRTVAQGCSISFLPKSPVSYSTNIAPILLGKCVTCHSPGNVAPWAMTNHAIVNLYGPLIKNQIMAGHMPPWHADPFYGPFSSDFSLSPTQTAMLIQWINEGSPRGAGPDPLAVTAPPPTNYPFAWPAALGQPTQILSIPVQSIPAAPGIETYRYINVTTTFSTDVWLRAAIIKPGNIRVVHHSLVFQGGNTSGMGIDGFFSGYVPGYEAVAFPPGTAKFLPRGTVLQFQMHYVRTASPQTDQTQIGLYTTPVAPDHELQTKSAYNFFSIPPNSTYEATAQYPLSGTLPRDILLYEMSPHMHTRGAHFKYEAVYSDGTRETLLSVPRYEFAWQALYRLAQPKFLPAGSTIVCTGGWDNTPQNEHLMEHYIDYSTQPPTTNSLFAPTRRVGFGDQTYDEMFIGYINFAELP